MPGENGNLERSIKEMTNYEAHGTLIVISMLLVSMDEDDTSLLKELMILVASLERFGLKK